VKNVLQDEVTASELPDEPWTAAPLADYFPTPLSQRYADAMSTHRLRREITSLVLVNEVVNRGGTSFVFRAMEETGASPADVLRAYVIVRDVYRLPDLWSSLERLGCQVPVAGQTAVYLGTRRLLDRAVRWLLQSRPSPLDVPGEVAALEPGVSRLLPNLAELLRGTERDAFSAQRDSFAAQGLPAPIAARAAQLAYSFGLLDIVEVARRAGLDPATPAIEAAAEVYFILSERFGIDSLLSKISALPREDRWQTLARMALRYDLYAALAALTSEVLTSTSPEAFPGDRVKAWERRGAASIVRAQNAIGEFDSSGADLAALSVVLRQIRTLVRTTAA
jgi:glutamate dehydrogenase